MLQGTFVEKTRLARQLLQEKGLLPFLRQDFRNFMDRLAVQLRARHYTRGFHRLYYHSAYDSPPRTWRSNSWLGIPLQKCPLDLLVYQEIIYQTKPEVVIETGTLQGGSALFFASIFDLLGQGHVITIDIRDVAQVQHPRITRLIGSSTDPAVLQRVRELVQDRSAIVILDSDHSQAHVLRELELYSPFVAVGNYLIVEDTNINGHPIGWQYGAGPTEALEEFLCHRDDFIVDERCEKHLLTFNPGGYLRRIKEQAGTTKSS